MKRTSPLAILAIGILGCAATPAAVLVRGPDGETNWVSISCKGDPTACELLAGESCPAGYDFGPSSYQNIQGAPTKSGPAIGPIGQGAQGVMWGGHVLVKCHGPAAVIQAAAETGAPAAPPPPAAASCHGRSCAPREVEDPSASGAQRPE